MMQKKLFTNQNAFLKYHYLEDFALILEGLAVVQTAINEYLLMEHVACEPDSGKFSDNDFARLAGMSAAVTQKLADDAYFHIEQLNRIENEIDQAEEKNSGFKERKAA